MEIWPYINERLNAGETVVLLWVLESEGSSPGRRGFKMAVASGGSFSGTIGGGIMEHKLVEKARSKLEKNDPAIFLMRQHHDKEHTTDRSGMICSGSQLIAFVPLTNDSIGLINNIIGSKENRNKIIELSPRGLNISENSETGLEYADETNWVYKELIDQRPLVHIIGGGHVGLALSQLLSFLGFYIRIYDNRKGLSTLEENVFAQEKHIVDYDNIGNFINVSATDYVVIMTFGYRDDKIVFKQLIDKEFFYAGMMGSESKIETLFKEMETEGIDPSKWKNWHIPIGINIFSKTTKEIAVSIAAEMIREKNMHLPTGRKLIYEPQ